MSAYRGAPDQHAVAVAVLCVPCGKTVELLSSDVTFQCPRCGRDQPWLRDDTSFELQSLEGVSHLRGSYRELEPFAGSVGLNDSCVSVTVRCDGVTCHVSLDLNSGSVCGLDLVAFTANLPVATYRRELVEDGEAKASGLTCEVQTGDEAFDRAVFIESDAASHDVLAPLASPAVRAALLRLFEDFRAVTVAADSVRLNTTLVPNVFDPARIRAQLGALRVVAGAARHVTPTVVRLGWVNATIWIHAILLVPAALGLGLAAYLFTPLGPGLYGYGLVTGFALGLLNFPIAKWILRGRSTSAGDVPFARGSALVALPLVMATLAVTVNGAFDGSPLRLHTLEARSVEYDSENHESQVTVDGPAPQGSRSYSFADKSRKAKLPATVVVGVKAGLLGFPWKAKDAKLRIGSEVLTE